MTPTLVPPAGTAAPAASTTGASTLPTGHAQQLRQHQHHLDQHQPDQLKQHQQQHQLLHPLPPPHPHAPAPEQPGPHQLRQHQSASAAAHAPRPYCPPVASTDTNTNTSTITSSATPSPPSAHAATPPQADSPPRRRLTLSRGTTPSPPASPATAPADHPSQTRLSARPPHAPHASFTAMSGLPVPLRHVAAVRADGTLVYYAARHARPCLPSRRTLLTRHLLARAPPPLSPALNAALADKAVLIVANPAAGSGAHAHETVLATLTTILADAGLATTLRRTAGPRHATALLAELRDALPRFAAVLSVGGDGTLQEVLNALVAAAPPVGSSLSSLTSSSTSASAASPRRVSGPRSPLPKLPPLAVIPAGSGNAIAVSQHVPTVEHAALNVVHSLREGAVAAQPVAVLQYRRLSAVRRERLVIGGVQWGLPAEVDQRTERLRFLGDLRFDLGAVAAVLSGARFRARIKVEVDEAKQVDAWCRVEALRRAPGQPLVSGCVTQTSDDTYVLNGEFVLAVAWNARAIADGFVLTPLARVTETGVFDLMVLPADGLSRVELFRLLLRVNDGGFMSVTDKFKYFKAKRVAFERIEGKHLTVDGESVPVEPFVLDIAPEDGMISLLDSFSEERE